MAKLLRANKADAGAPARRATSRRTLSLCLSAVVVVRLVDGWLSAGAVATGSCQGAAHRFETFALFAPALERAKQILVYLPPGYDCARAGRYPVFYLNDGHDLFDWSPSAAGLEPAVAADVAAREAWYGSWRLEHQLDGAIADGRLPPMIVVGIASDDGMRSRDLVPVPWAGSGEGRGAQYGNFIAQTVVPAIDRRFRTVADRRCRGIGGASLGGISALQIGLAHPERFGLVLAFSPVLGDPAIARYLAAAWPAAGQADTSAFLIDFDDAAIGSADRAWFASVLATVPSSGRHAALVQAPGGRHAIASWAERVIPALQHLLAAQSSNRCAETPRGVSRRLGAARLVRPLAPCIESRLFDLWLYAGAAFTAPSKLLCPGRAPAYIFSRALVSSSYTWLGAARQRRPPLRVPSHQSTLARAVESPDAPTNAGSHCSVSEMFVK